MRLQFVLRRLRYQPAIAVLLGPLQLVVVEGDILGSHAKETADAYDDGFRHAVLVEDHVGDLADIFGIVASAIVDGFADDVGDDAAFSARYRRRRGRLLGGG